MRQYFDGLRAPHVYNGSELKLVWCVVDNRNGNEVPSILDWPLLIMRRNHTMLSKISYVGRWLFGRKALLSVRVVAHESILTSPSRKGPGSPDRGAAEISDLKIESMKDSITYSYTRANWSVRVVDPYKNVRYR
jgi:hypothetical protein